MALLWHIFSTLSQVMIQMHWTISIIWQLNSPVMASRPEYTLAYFGWEALVYPSTGCSLTFSVSLMACYVGSSKELSTSTRRGTRWVINNWASVQFKFSVGWFDGAPNGNDCKSMFHLQMVSTGTGPYCSLAGQWLHLMIDERPGGLCSLVHCSTTAACRRPFGVHSLCHILSQLLRLGEMTLPKNR